MKRKTAKELLAESFRELAETKNIDKITVQDIVENCGYSPATFYRHYKDKYDLIAWEYSQQTANIMGRIGEDGYEWKQTLIDGARHYDRERDYLANLFSHTSGHNSFIQYMTEINYSALRNYTISICEEKPLDKSTEMYLRIYCLGTVSLTCEWIFGKFQATPEELAEVYENSLPEPLRKYLH